MIRVIAAVLASVLAAVLVLVQPWAGRRRYLRLVASIGEHPDARMRHYRRGIVGEWAAVGVILVIGVLAGRGRSSIGLVLGRHVGSEVAVVAELAALLAASALVFRFGGAGIQSALRRQARGFLALLPRGRQERLVFAGLAITAGICEELIFRGFGIAYLRWLWPASPEWAVIAITATAFGLVHLYQGPRGVILTGVVGAYLAWLVLSTGSLLPAMVIHALLDLRVLALPDVDRAPPARADNDGLSQRDGAPTTGAPFSHPAS
jgi:uncharacterized protein